MKKVAVFGATGNFGLFVVATLLEDFQLSATTFSRSWKDAHEQLRGQWVKKGGSCQEVAM
jgi:aspartate-semialdehyde dehydrogenase